MHKSKDCSRYQYLISPKARRRLVYKIKERIQCPAHDGVVILNDKWVFNLRGPKLSVIKLRKRDRR
jgi:hypothetical protein